jgi:hypothetical protein
MKIDLECSANYIIHMFYPSVIKAAEDVIQKEAVENLLSSFLAHNPFLLCAMACATI